MKFQFGPNSKIENSKYTCSSNKMHTKRQLTTHPFSVVYYSLPCVKLARIYKRKCAGISSFVQNEISILLKFQI